MLKPLFSMLSPAGPKARLSIFIFHRVLAAPDPVFPGEVHARRFDTLCSWLRGWFNILPLDEAVRRLRNGTLPARAACITFDDGYADNHDQALPILRRHGLNATFFIATGFLGGGRMFNDSVIEILRRAQGPSLDLGGLGIEGMGRFDLSSADARRHAIEAILPAIKYRPLAEREELALAIQARAGVGNLPNDLMMTTEQVRALHRAGMRIGAHTRSHPILARLGREEARAEIEGGRDDLQHLLGEPVTLFAYPNGKPGKDYSRESVALVQEIGFEAAAATAWGAAGMASDPFQLPRFTPWDRSQSRFGLRMIGQLRGGAAVRV
jgi:peptidoglycan/xylan/chitin deacetylase (PgdA/CDA1 family)